MLHLSNAAMWEVSKTPCCRPQSRRGPCTHLGATFGKIQGKSLPAYPELDTCFFPTSPQRISRCVFYRSLCTYDKQAQNPSLPVHRL